MRKSYSPLELNRSYQMKVSSLHTLYVEESGNPHGLPIVFVHGGPGGGTEASHRTYFDPKKFRIILFDQRGCGKSVPYASLEQNTTWDLVADMEKIREHLGIERWHVFGGSWGSTLSLVYAISHPDRVLSLTLRGIFLLRKKEIDWFYQNGASRIFPDRWESFLEAIPEAERHDLLSAYAKRLMSSDHQAMQKAAKAWSVWEGSTARLLPDPSFLERFGMDEFAVAFARIECHYFINKGFFPEDNWILNNISKISKIPGTIIQGRYDMICPMESAWDLHKAWKLSKLVIVPDGAHAAGEASMTSALIEATDRI